MNFQLFAMTGLFRNQQVAGSIPAGGSSLKSATFPRQRRRNPLRCQRMKVSGLTFTRAPRHKNMRARIT